MSFSNDYENKVLNWVFTANAVTRPTTWYLALFTADPTDAETMAGEVPNSFAYARQTVTFTVTADTATNNAVVEWPAASGGGWGTVTHVAVTEGATHGVADIIASAALTTSKAIADGDVFRVPLGDLDITLD